MDLHSVFMEQLERLIREKAVDLIAEKLRAHDVTLSNKDRKRLQDAFEKNAPGHLTMGRKWWWGGSKTIELSVSDEDLAELDAYVDRLIERIPEISDRLCKEFAPECLTYVKRAWPEERKRLALEAAAFHDDLAQLWTEPIDALTLLIELAQRVGENVNAHCRRGSSVTALENVLTRLHARGMQVASEVLTLLRAGYADGAIARWRTLHEICVVASFIDDRGELCAQRYLDHAIVESWRAADAYARFYVRLGFDPPDPNDLDELKRKRDTVLKKYGSEYGDLYGWAAQYLKRERPNFADIEKAVSLDHIRPFYQLASHNVHANPKGILFKLGLLNEDVLLAGPSSLGLADPGQNTAVSVVQLTAILVQYYPVLDALVSGHIMLVLSEEICDQFVSVEKNIEDSNFKKLRL